jgi:hypothetical protein
MATTQAPLVGLTEVKQQPLNEFRQLHARPQAVSDGAGAGDAARSAVHCAPAAPASVQDHPTWVVLLSEGARRAGIRVNGCAGVLQTPDYTTQLYTYP